MTWLGVSRALVGVALLASAAILSAQAIPPPPPPPPPPPGLQDYRATGPQQGTATLSGAVVVNDASAQPIHRVILLLNGGGLIVARQTTTDDDGRFTFPSLPAGRYSLSGWRSGYVRDVYGSKHPGDAFGVGIDLANGARVDVTMRLTRQAVISGTVLSSAMPVSAGYVQALQFKRQYGERRLFPASAGTSPNGGSPGIIDDRGAYRIYGLAPGEYVIMTSPYSSGDVRMMTQSLVDWATQVFRRNGTAPSNAPPAGRSVGYAPVYYPGTTDVTAAVTVRVGSGEERSGIDLPLQLVPVAKIEGIVTGPGGQAVPNAQLSLRPAGSLLMDQTSGITRSGTDGRFTMSGVPPGRHILTVRAAPAGAAGRGGIGTASGSVMLSAVAELNVAGQDISALALALQPGTTITGRLAFDGQSTPPPNSSLRISLSPQPMDYSVPRPSAIAGDDGTITIGGIAPGSYRLANFSTPGGWTIRSAMLEGHDLMDEAVEIRAGQPVTGLIVTFTDRRSSVSGTLVGADGNTTADYFIVAFPTDRKLWTWESRRVASARPNNAGAFVFSALPAGEYFLCAVTDLDPTEMYDPAILEPLMAASLKFTLAEGEQKVQNLKINR